MPSKSHLTPRRPGTAAPAIPAHLEEPERELWRDFTAAHRFDDAASLALLRTTLEAHQRSRRCREAIDGDGETIRDRFGQIKPHPLIPAERDARSAFLAGMKARSTST